MRDLNNVHPASITFLSSLTTVSQTRRMRLLANNVTIVNLVASPFVLFVCNNSDIALIEVERLSGDGWEDEIVIRSGSDFVPCPVLGGGKIVSKGISFEEFAIASASNCCCFSISSLSSILNDSIVVPSLSLFDLERSAPEVDSIPSPLCPITLTFFETTLATVELDFMGARLPTFAFNRLKSVGAFWFGFPAEAASRFPEELFPFPEEPPFGGMVV